VTRGEVYLLDVLALLRTWASTDELEAETHYTKDHLLVLLGRLHRRRKVARRAGEDGEPDSWKIVRLPARLDGGARPPMVTRRALDGAAPRVRR